jgi:uncharacterized delta-60 repeat protein
MAKGLMANRASVFCALILLAANGLSAARANPAELFVKQATLTESPQAAGDLDTTFGTGGRQTADLFNNQDGAAGVAIQSDGKVVAAGYASHSSDPTTMDFAVTRYNPDGSPDQAFGNGGKQTTDFFGNQDQAYRVAIQADGKIVVVGYATRVNKSITLAIARYNPDGTPDQSFGVGGKQVTDFFGIRDYAWGLTFDSDGKIVVVGSALWHNPDPSGFDFPYFALARYNGDGTLDQSFGSGGKQTTDFFSNGSVGVGVRIQGDGKIVAAGYAAVDSHNTKTDFAIARYNPDGSLDQSFGGGGKQTTGFVGNWALGDAVAIQADGKIVVGGYAETGAYVSPTSDFALARYNQDGTLDQSFGSGGMQRTDFFGNCDQSFDLGIQSDGKIVLGGFAQARDGDSNRDFAVARYNSDGSLDQSFGSGGRQVTDFFGGQDIAFGLALQPDDKIVLAGFVAHGGAPSSWDLGLARYSPGLIPPDFSVAFSAASITATAGSKVHATLTITRKGGFNGTVTVTPPQPAMGIKSKPLDPITVTGDTAVFKIKVGDGVSPGSYDLIFTAADDSARTHSAKVTIMVP